MRSLRWITPSLTIVTAALFCHYLFWSSSGFSPDVLSSATKKKSSGGGGGGGGSRRGGGSAKQDPSAIAKTLYEKGMKEYKDGQLLAARRDLNDALLDNPGALAETLASKARATLTEIAEKAIFSSEVISGDPYVFQYAARMGDTGTDMMNKCRAAFCVNPKFVLQTNKLEPATKLEKGQNVKFVKGPFAALVNKSGEYLDLYLFPADLDPLFLKRVTIKIGTDRSVPLGNFKVAKMADKAPYLPPGNIEKAIPYGAADYPLDDAGRWITLATSNICALHACKEGSSKPGYVVMKAKDLEEIYNLFLERYSLVYIMASK